MNEYVNILKHGTNIRVFFNGIEFTQSHQPEEAIPDWLILTTNVNQACDSVIVTMTLGRSIFDRQK